MRSVEVVDDVAAYLTERRNRRPVMFYEEENHLFVKLPTPQRDEVRAMQAAFKRVLTLVKTCSVTQAVKTILGIYKHRSWKPVTFRAKFDAWRKTRDWLALVNRSKAGADWQETRDGLPLEFLIYCASRIGKYKRMDARKEALLSIIRQWRTGRTFEGEATPIPGYGFKVDWLKLNADQARGDIPHGWSYSNIMRQIKARQVLSRAAHALLVEGTHAAKQLLPDVSDSRARFRFMERIQFDDVKTDWRIIDPASGETMDLWLLVARDVATTMLLGFGMRPAKAREDGSQEHLKLADMKQLCGWILERYGLPPYLMTWVIENGTATLSHGSVGALREMLGDKIAVVYASMNGGISPNGYFERRSGNSTAKASLESHNRGMHIIGAALPGQTGPHYGVRPSDLQAREKEAREIAMLADFLPPHLKSQVGFPVLTKIQARENLIKIFAIQNTRDDHTLEGFEEVVEWWDGQAWQPQSTAPNGNIQCRRRMETPAERASRFVNEAMGAGSARWTRVSPEIITAFYEHTQRSEVVQPSGEIHFRVDRRMLRFTSPTGKYPAPGTRLLCYFHPDDPTLLYLTDGKGSIIGVWLQVGHASSRDALAQAMAHQARAMKAAREQAHELATEDRERLDTMRASNAALHQANDFIEVAPSQITEGAQHTSPVAKALTSAKRVKAEKKERDNEFKDAAALAAEALMDAHS